MNKIKRFSRIFYNLFFDLKYGSFLGGTKKTPYELMGAHDTANTGYYAMNSIFQNLISPNEVLVDIGCGKGRVINYWLDAFSDNQIIGIELDNLVAENTSARLSKFSNVTIISGNIINTLPDNGTLFYLYNPFNCQVMNEFKESLISKFYINNLGWIKLFQIVYYNPICINIFIEDVRFICTELKLPSECHKCYLIKVLTVN
ncbi:MAG: hypothetical protein A2W85_09910 [Bacteroidetes bacterium GWF2_41_31]|nr:MAG: hypothetical protein A2W85_09910 [Bacteroidetes bacterium GWF2_41_31]